MAVEFTLRKRRHQATREDVIEALREVEPEPQTPYMVTIEGIDYPLRQAFGEVFGVGRNLAGTSAMERVFERLGFETKRGRRMESRPRPQRPYAPWRPRDRFGRRDELEVQELELGTITLRWSYYESWKDLAEGNPEIDPPPTEAGVYQVGRASPHDSASLYIGRAADLKSRICYGLISGTALHTSGRKIRENEDLTRVHVRWAVTDRPAAAEEALHQAHLALFGYLPKYVTRT